jgi:hypothetical protein
MSQGTPTLQMTLAIQASERRGETGTTGSQVTLMRGQAKINRIRNKTLHPSNPLQRASISQTITAPHKS